MARRKPRLRVVPLGGLDEIGKNMTVLEYGNEMVVIDAGLMFPDEDHPGVDLILPDYSYILKNKDKLRGIIITHGHEDHTGALPYLLKDLDQSVPVLGSRLTLGLLRPKLEEHGIKKPKLREVKAGSHVNLGVFGFDFLPVNHSIPDALALVARTPVGDVLHTGDFKFDQTPIDGRLADYAGFSKAGKRGVKLLLSDSTNAERPGVTMSEAEVGKTLHEVIADADQRVIVASFASHIHRLQQVIDAAVANGRKVAVTGRSMLNNTRIARDLGILEIDDNDLIDAYDIGGIPADELVVLSTGSQGEPLSALARMANGDHKTVQIEAGDTVIISATPVPGNEKAVSRIINRLAKQGANVVHKDIARVHVSGHGAAEDCKLMLNLVQPQYFMPVHGETRHLAAHARLAEAVGIPEENIFVCDNGDVLEIDDRGVRQVDRVESGVVYVDGLKLGDPAHPMLRDRQVLASDGIVTVVVAVDAQTGKLNGEPEIVARGVVLGENEELLDEAKARITKKIGKLADEGVRDSQLMRNAVRESISQLFWEKIRRRPMIIPVVMEV